MIKQIKEAIWGPKTKKIAGVFFIALGLILHLIPLFPAGWIIVIGLELLGIRLLLQNGIKDRLLNFKIFRRWSK
jgi:hypothetical protein